VPTLAETGVSNIAVAGWHGLVAPRGTDPAIISRINQAVGEVLRNPEVRDRLGALGIEPVDAPPAALTAKLREDAERWAPLIRRTGMQPD
jgi:tripartite-type tricarboxylate transporter receptor subunit TctC